MRLLNHLISVGPVVSRIVAAVLGGYGLAALVSIAVLVLPVSKPQAVLTGMQISFAVYAVAVIWVFAARSAWRAWLGLLIAAIPFACAAWFVWAGGTAV